VFQPGIDCLEWLGIELVHPVASAAVLYYQTRISQLAQVLGNGRAGHRKGFCDATGGLFPLTEQIENGAAGGIGQRVKCGF